ncbi:STAS domain-containing protein [Streptomyces sp. NPDC047072]|uniref:STAS domain-containing protein n=1 Tax=Streptomyces sp. NPDC047072 TaxID=3154809 RepID=UPI0033E1741F
MHDDSLAPVTTLPWPPGPADLPLMGGVEGLLVAELHGDLDLATTHHLRYWLDSLAALAAPAYVLDLRPVSFVDSAGLGPVLRLRRRVLADGAAFAVVCSPGTRRLLRAHGTLELLDPVDSMGEATVRLT